MMENNGRSENEKRRLEFISGISHELKTPIALIQGYAEGLKAQTYEDTQTRDYYCDVIIDEAKKMNQIIKKLFRLSSLEYEPYDVFLEEFDLSELVYNCCLQGNVLAKKSGARIKYDGEEGCLVCSDISLIEDVIRNYLANAINYTTGDKHIDVRVERRENVIRVTVYNTGELIPKEYMPYIWEKFYKVDKSRNREYGGTGIGLSVVRAIMNKLSGDCGVENKDDGVEFWFELKA